MKDIEQPVEDSQEEAVDTEVAETEEKEIADEASSNEEFDKKLSAALDNELKGTAKKVEANKPQEKEVKVEGEEGKVDFKPIEWESKDGTKYKVSSLDDLKNGWMRQADYTKKTQELSKFRKTYESFEKEIDKDPNLKQAIGLLYNVPQMREAAVQLYAELVKRNKLHPSEVEANVYKRQVNDIKEREAQVEEQRVVEHYNNLVAEQIASIKEEIGDELTKEYYDNLVALVKSGKAGDLEAAHKLHQIESGAYEKRIAEKLTREKRSKQEKIKQASSIRPTGDTKSSSSGNGGDFDNALWSALQKV